MATEQAEERNERAPHGRDGSEADTVSYNDIDLRRWKEYPHVETDSLWLIPSRERSNGHRLEYHGNFVPQIATQLLLRYTKEGEVVLDLFLGCGTTAIEAVRLGRRCLGVELRPELCAHVAAKLPDAVAAGAVRILAGDSTLPETRDRLATEMRGAWGRDAADLLILHPPYADIIRFSDDPADLSNRGSTEAFLAAFQQAAAHGFELLRPGRFAALVMGDKYADGELIPLGFLCMQRMIDAGFRPKSIVVKNIEGNEVGKGRTNNLWRYRALKGGFYIFKHEYVMVFQKPARESKARVASKAMREFKVIVEKHPDGYVAYPPGLKGVVVGEGNTFEEALSDVESAIRSHIETFGPDVVEIESPAVEVFVAEARVAVRGRCRGSESPPPPG